MRYIKTYEKKNTNVLRINYERKLIQINPDYQRNGDIWTKEKRQLLIDSVLNDYDIPKLYFHVLDSKKREKTGKEYAVIDGRQRLETFWYFLDNKFPLADDFVFYKDKTIKAGGLYYKDIAKEYPELKMLFDSFEIPIILIETTDLELIDEMFSRLNEAVPLNAAEKRNAFGGPAVKSINTVASNTFFKSRVKFSNKRYQYKEVAVRLLFIVFSLEHDNKIIDTKKVYLDGFVTRFKNDKQLNIKDYEQEVLYVLDEMNNIFAPKDTLLVTQSIIPIYFLLFRDLLNSGTRIDFNRKIFIDFKKEIQLNKKIAEEDITQANFDFLEFDRLSIQGTNDASSIKQRLKILKEYVLERI